MHRLSPARAALLLATTTTMVACQEPPSFRTRWSVIDREGKTQPTTAPLVCTSLGINTVRVRVIDEAGDIVNDAYHACFARGFADPDATAPGPGLAAGRYAVEVRGVQRNLEPWPVAIGAGEPLTVCGLDGLDCDPRDIACDCVDVDVRDEHTERLVDFVLGAPDECIDGIDNDRDGLLDAADPSCGLAVTPGREGSPVSKVQFRVALTLLGGNDVVTCSSVGLIDVQARVCPRVAGEAPAPCEVDGQTAVLACQVGDAVFFEQTLPEGEYTLELVGRGAQGVERTLSALFPISVSAGAGAFVPIDLDFSAAEFEPAIEARAGFLLTFADAGATAPRSCTPGPNSTGVALTDVVVEVLDAHGGVLDAPVTLSDGTVLDGTPIACPNSVVLTEALQWGGYSLRVAARAADGTVCFTTDGAGVGGVDAPLLLAPGTNVPLVIAAVVDDQGAPPTSCE